MSALVNGARTRVPRFAEAAVERARLTVVPRARSRAPRVPFVSLVSLLLIAGVAGLLMFNTSMQQASFHATALEERAGLLEARQQSLRMEIETLRDPQRVAVAARAMGMVPPSSPAFLRLSDGEVLGAPAPAAAEDAIRVVPLPMPKPKNLRPDPVVVRPPTDVTGAGRTGGQGQQAAAEDRPSKSGGRDGAADDGGDGRAGTKERTSRTDRQGSRR